MIIVSIPGEHISAVAGQTPDCQLNVADEALLTASQLNRRPTNLVTDLLAAFGLWAVSVLAVFIVPTIIALPYIMFRYWGASDVSQSLATNHTVLLLTVIGVIPAHGLTFLAARAVVTMPGRRPFWSTIGWSFSPKFGFWPAAGVAVVLYFAGAILAKLIGGGPTDIDILVNSSLAVRILLAILATTTGPLVEEIVYRGVLYTALEKSIGTAVEAGLGVARAKSIGMALSIAIVSILFAAVHVYQYRNNVGVIVVIVMLSVSLTLVRAFTGRLLPCFIIHMVFNGIVSVLIVLQPYVEQIEKTITPKTGMIILFRFLNVCT